MAIILNDNVKINAGKPSEAKYLNPNTNTPYTSAAQVNTLIPISERHVGLTVLINNTEYWYKNGVSNLDLVLKTFSVSGFTPLTLFTGYTATTEVTLQGIEDDIEYISGITDTKLSISNFNLYTGATAIELSNINSELDLTITGITVGTNLSKLQTGRVVNIEFTGTTGGGSGERIEKTFTQIGHTFSFGDVVEYSGNTFVKGLAVVGRDSELIGFISNVSGNNFTIVFSGYIEGISGLSLSTNTTYYLSSTVEGGLTSTPPINENTINKPILTTFTSNDGLVLHYRGYVNSTGLTGNITGNTSGYTNLTQFVNQTPWRLFYSNNNGDVTELPLGSGNTYLKSNGVSAIPTWEVPLGSITSFSDSDFEIYDNIDNTKIAKFQLSGLTSGTTRTYNLPDVNGTLVNTNANNAFTGWNTFSQYLVPFQNSKVLGTNINGLIFSALDSNDDIAYYATVKTQIATNTAGNEDGTFVIDVISNGVLSGESLKINGLNDKSVQVFGPLKIKDYTTVGLPAFSTHAYSLVYDTTTNEVKYSNGSAWLPLGGSGGISSGDNVAWTGTHSFLDNNFSLLDNTDNTKVAQFQLSGLTSGTTRTYTLPDNDGTVALLSNLSGFLNGTLTADATVEIGSNELVFSTTNDASYFKTILGNILSGYSVQFIVANDQVNQSFTGVQIYTNDTVSGDGSLFDLGTGLITILGSAYAQIGGGGVEFIMTANGMRFTEAQNEGDILYATGISTDKYLKPLNIGGAGKILRSTGTAPSWSTLTIPDTIAANSLLVSNSTNTLVALTATGGQSIRRNAGNTAWETFSPVDLSSIQDITGIKTFFSTSLLLRNIANTHSAAFSNSITAPRTYTFPDATGTLLINSFNNSVTTNFKLSQVDGADTKVLEFLSTSTRLLNTNSGNGRVTSMSIGTSWDIDTNISGTSRMRIRSIDGVIEHTADEHHFRADNSSTPASIRLYGSVTGGSNYITLGVPTSLPSNLVFTLPNSYGLNNQVLTTNGSGELFWANVSGNTTGITISDLPNMITDTITGTTYTLVVSDNRKVLRFTNSSNITVSVPNGLDLGFSVILLKSGIGNIVLNVTGTLEGQDTLSGTAPQLGTLYSRDTNTWVSSFGSTGNSSGYTNLTEFDNQTAWRLFYSDGNGDVTELSFGSNGTYLKSNGISAVPTWETPSGGTGSTNTLNGSIITNNSYTANTESHFIGVSATTATTIFLPSAPKNYQQIIISDIVGNADVNNITINGNGNLIRGFSTAVIDSQYSSITLVYNTINWSIISSI